MKLSALTFILLLHACGKGPMNRCVPQMVMIAGCQVKAYKKNPYPYLQEIQLQQCKRKYPYDVCYSQQKD